MLSEELRFLVEQKTGQIHKQSVLSGGDIHRAYILTAASTRWVAKVATDSSKIESLKAEIHGLELLASTQSFRIPQVLGLFETETETSLVMEFIESSTPDSRFWESFAGQLAKLHSNTQKEFGLDRDNYIGALTQVNKPAASAVEFYIESRMEPQFKIARDAGYSFKTDSFYQKLEQLIPAQQPALIHGDLWNENYLCSHSGPVLIDPAVSYSIAEMDLAMMALFGGFNAPVFEYYSEITGLDSMWKSRIELWQLYYLLVHLNLFGSSYYGSVKRILTNYS